MLHRSMMTAQILDDMSEYEPMYIATSDDACDVLHSFSAPALHEVMIRQSAVRLGAGIRAVHNALRRCTFGGEHQQRGVICADGCTMRTLLH